MRPLFVGAIPRGPFRAASPKPTGFRPRQNAPWTLLRSMGEVAVRLTGSTSSNLEPGPGKVVSAARGTYTPDHPRVDCMSPNTQPRTLLSMNRKATLTLIAITFVILVAVQVLAFRHSGWNPGVVMGITLLVILAAAVYQRSD